MSLDCLLRNARLVVPHQGIFEASVGIKDGVIAAIYRGSEADVPSEQGTKVIDVDGRYVLPGVIEAHAHWGRRDWADEFLRETQVAAKGGVTTMFNFLGRPGSYHLQFDQIDAAGRECSHIDFALHLGIMSDTHYDEIEEYVSKYGVRSFKFYMAYKGDEGKVFNVQGCDDGLLFDGFAKLARVDRAVACVHAENVEVSWRFKDRLIAQGRDDLAAYSESRPDFCEAENVQRAYYFGKVTGCPVYVVHLTSKAGLDMVREWKQKLPAAYVETCTPYLTHTMHTPIGKIAKCNPPLRLEADIEALWEGLFDRTIDTVATDHATSTTRQKLGSIWETPPGVQGSGTLLPVLLSEGVNRRGLGLERVAEVTSHNVAKIFNLYPRKGAIQIGSDADFTVVDLGLAKTVTAAELGSYADYTIYEGQTLKGWPVLTMVRGVVVMQDGQIVGPKGHGRYLYR
ncbi:MAG: amidohydrolase family protein [Chloroflexi bacterium]|nr:amidohydrolase family protein [Chloroflexota bacterium]